MGYYVCGGGDATLKKGINIDELENILKEIVSERCMEMDFNIHNKSGDIWFSECDSHWHEEDTEAFLDALKPYITEGSAEYRGDDGCYWRYVYHPGNMSCWEEQYGTIYYSTEDMIAELERQGYAVTKQQI